MSIIKKLFNIKAIKSVNKKNHMVVAIVYKDIYNNGNKGEITSIISLENYFRSMGRSLDDITIIPMEKGRIMGTSIEFDEVYYFKDIEESIESFIMRSYKNTRLLW